MAFTFLNTAHKCVILGSACVISLIVWGLSTIFGLLFAASLQRYGASRNVTSIPFVLAHALKVFVGPLGGYLSGKFGQRFVIVTGSLLCILGFGLSFFADDIVYIIIFIGVFFGIGYGFTINMLPQALLHEFKDHLDKANGIYHGFGSIGSFVMIRIAETLLFRYGLSGTCLILSGIALHTVPAAVLLRKIRNTESPKSSKNDKKITKTAPTNNEEFDSYDDIRSDKTGKLSDNLTRDVKLVSINKPSNKSEMYSKQECFVVESTTSQVVADHCSQNKDPLSVLHTQTQEESSKESQLNKQLPSASFRVFLDPAFLLQCFIQSISGFTFVTFWVIFFDAALDKGISNEEGVQIISVAVFPQVVGKFSVGFLTDGGCISKINFATFGFAILGTTYLVFVWLDGFFIILIAMCLLEMLIGSLITVFIGIVTIYSDKDHIRMATASRFFLLAPLSICGPYIIGYFRDTLKSYDGLFYTLSTLCFLCAILNSLTPALARFRDERKKAFIINKTNIS